MSWATPIPQLLPALKPEINFGIVTTFTCHFKCPGEEEETDGKNAREGD